MPFIPDNIDSNRSGGRFVPDKYQESEQPDSIMKNMSEGKNVIDATGQFMSEHPFKTAFQGPTETITGETAQSKLLKAQPYTMLPGRDLPVAGPVVKGAEIAFNTFKDMPASAAGFAADQLSPANIATLGISKIPGVVKAGEALGKTAPVKAIGRFLTKERGLPMSQQHLDNRIYKLYEKAVGGVKIKNVGDASKIKNDRLEAVKAISDNMDDVRLPDIETGELVNRIPDNNYENVLAYRQAQQSVWKKASGLSKGATDAGATIDMNPIVQKSLNEVVDNIGEDALKANPSLFKSIIREANNVRKIGTTNPTKAEAYMKSLNNELTNFYKTGAKVDYSVLDFKRALIRNLNKSSEDVIESVLSKPGYGAYRRQYGALKSAEKEIIRAGNKQLSQEAGQGGLAHGITDFWSLQEVIGGAGQILTGNVGGGIASIAKGTGLKATSKLLDYYKSPNKAMKKMYELLGKRAKIGPMKQATSFGGPVSAEVVSPQPPDRLPAPPVVNPYAKGLPSPRQASGQVAQPEIQQGYQAPAALPAPQVKTPRPAWKQPETPEVINQRGPSQIMTVDQSNPNVNFIQPREIVKPSQARQVDMSKGGRDILKPNKYIKSSEIDDFNEMKNMIDSKEWNVKINGADKVIMKVSNGDKLTIGEQMTLKRIKAAYKKR